MRSRLLPILLLTAGVLCAQPRVDLIQNNYSYLTPDNPNYGIAQGAIVIIKGSDLANTATTLQNIPLKTSLNGVSAQVTVNNVTKDLILYYVMPSVIGAIIPSATPVGTGTLTVTNNGQLSPPAPITIVRQGLGLATADGSGLGRALATDANYNLLTPAHPTKPGDIILFFGTGLGANTGDETTTQTQGNLGVGGITIGGKGASTFYAGRTVYPGLDQLNVQVPSQPGNQIVPPLTGSQLGCNVAVTGISLAGLRTNTVTIPVSADGSPCTDPVVPSDGISSPATITQTDVNQWVATGQYRSGGIRLTRSLIYRADPFQDAGPTAYTVEDGDRIDASFSRLAGPDLAKTVPKPSSTPATPGTCTVQSSTSATSGTVVNVTSTSLDAGTAVGVSSVNGLRMAPKSVNSSGSSIGYQANIGSGGPHDYLDPGHYTFFSPGGPDVGAFSGGIDLTETALQWTNRESLQTVNRADGLTVTWTGLSDPTETLAIIGTSSLPIVVVNGVPPASTPPFAQFVCSASVADGKFTVPASILTQLLATQTTTVPPANLQQINYGSLTLSVNHSVRLQATGIDYLTGSVSNEIQQSVNWK